MARDFAKQRNQSGTRRRTPARKKTPARRTATTRQSFGHKLQWFLAGLGTGMVLSLLVYVGTLPGPGESNFGNDGNLAARGELGPEAPPKPRFDFYHLLPEQSLEEIEAEPASVAKPRSSQPRELYLLQAGSFRQREDADRRRAELLLLGLEPRIESTDGDNGRWYRVYIGPFDSHSRMSKARSLTAAQDIDTLLLKRSQPQ